MVIVFTNTKGGVGKSTLAVHFAVWLHDRGICAAVVDADRQQSAAQWVREVSSEIEIVTALTPDTCVDAVTSLRKRVDCVLCDAPGGMDEISRSLLLVADFALLPICPSILDLRGVCEATKSLRYAQRINGDRPQGALVLNRMKRRDRISRELAQSLPELGIGAANSTIRDLQAFRDAAQQGTVVSRMNGRATAAAEDLHALAGEIFGGWVAETRTSMRSLVG